MIFGYCLRKIPSRLPFLNLCIEGLVLTAPRKSTSAPWVEMTALSPDTLPELQSTLVTDGFKKGCWSPGKEKGENL